MSARAKGVRGNWESAVPLAVAIATGAAISAGAGVKYWDNPAFKAYDVGDYVQSDLVWHYDGIRNQGATAAHSTTATTWKNLGSQANSDMTLKSTGSGDQGHWTSNGYVFAGHSKMNAADAAVDTGTSYSIQILMDAKAADQTMDTSANGNKPSYVFSGSWANLAFVLRKDGALPAPNSFYWNTQNGGNTGVRPYILTSSGTYSYATAVLNGSNKTAAFFSGTKPPTSGGIANGFYQYSSVGGVTGTGFSIGGYGANDSYFTGAIKMFRFYKHALSAEEVAWNRVVDEARFFNRRGAIPVTNVIVRTSNSLMPGGDQPDGCYGLDNAGFTFSASPSTRVNGQNYVCTGYTLEKWNGSGWDAPVLYAGRHTCTLTPADGKVRLEWLWMGGGEIVGYDESDYVSSGLCLHYDGICNQGAGQAHSSTATTWKNLGSEGSAYDLSLAKGNDASAWASDGYEYAGKTRFTQSAQRTWGPNLTVQVVVDAKRSALQHANSANYIFGTAWNACSLTWYKAAGRGLEFHTQGAPSGSPHYGPYLPAGDTLTYANAVLDGSRKSAAVFTGTVVPTGNSRTDVTNYTASVASYNNGFNLGGWGGGTDQYFKGRIKSFRFYNRVLSSAELAKNRRVDNYRYFGILEPETTNIVVASTYSNLGGLEPCGPYAINGSHTFVAPERLTGTNGIEYACAGYIVENKDGAGWGNASFHANAHSYKYQTSSGLVRLTWVWKPTRGLRTAADYRFADLSPAGLALHYDGLYNAGIGVARSMSATKWVNIGSRPGMDLSRATSGTDTAAFGAWGAKGYRFGGKAQFNSSRVSWPTTFSAQVLVDAKHADNAHASGNYIAATSWHMFGMQIYGAGQAGRFQMQTPDGSNASRVSFSAEGGLGYMTVTHDAVTKTATVFPDTKVPTENDVGYMKFDTFNGIEDNSFRLGGWGGGPGGSQNLVGTLYTFRYYDRVLTEEELVRNRNVDAARYFGALAVTNVLVQAGASGTQQAETGAYKVEGQWTFTAKTVKDWKGEIVKAGRCKIETLVDGQWKNRQYVNGAAYTYKEGESPATVRLTWLPAAPGMMLILQ